MQEPDQPITKKAKRITTGLLAVILVFLLILFLFWRITDEIVLEQETTFDTNIHKFLAAYTTPATTKVMLLFTFLGSREFLLPAYTLLAAFFLLYKRNIIQALGIVVIGLISRGLLLLLKSIFQRHRPLGQLAENFTGYSYPSGHSFSAFTFFGLLTYLVWKTDLSPGWKWILSVIFFLLAAEVAVSRVYLHAHFASDVIAGFCLSLLWLGIALWLLDKIQRSRRVKNL